MSLPHTDEHNCLSCAKKVPTCGRKRRQLEGHCIDWEAKQ
jgi:hypothetical protein